MNVYFRLLTIRKDLWSMDCLKRHSTGCHDSDAEFWTYLHKDNCSQLYNSSTVIFSSELSSKGSTTSIWVGSISVFYRLKNTILKIWIFKKVMIFILYKKIRGIKFNHYPFTKCDHVLQTRAEEKLSGRTCAKHA